MSDKALAELFAQPIPEPPLPPGHLERLLSRARRSRRRRRLRGALVALLTAMLAAVVPAALPNASSGGERVRLPDDIDGYFPLTATVGDHPPGRSLVLLRSGNWELFRTYQTLLIGTDGHTYRDLGVDGIYLLSPDGTMVIVGAQSEVSRELTVVNLVSGERRAIPLEKPRGIRFHAWSPDLRYVSYSTVEADQLDQSHFIEDQMRAAGVLSILDLETGRSTRFPELSPGRASAFAPDGRSLAVQIAPNEAWIVGLDGVKQRRLTLPPGTGIAPGVAWSPDGRTLATVPWPGPTEGTPAQAQVGPWTGMPGGLSIDFADADGNLLADPKPVKGRHLLGWRSPRSIITITYDFDSRAYDSATIQEIDLTTGQTTVLSRVEHGHACEFFTQSCLAGEFQVATGLLDRMEVTGSGLPDRGPRLTGIAASVLVVVLQLALLVAFGIRASTRRLARTRPRK